MKSLVTLIAVIALAAPVFAGDLVITPVDNGDGTLTINYTYTGDAPVGLALIVDSTGNGQAQSATGDSFFDVFIDFYNSNPGALNDGNFSDDGSNPAADPAGPGVATLPADVISLSMGRLDAVNPAPATGTLATVDFGGPASGTISGDMLRGCVVDINAAEMTINGQPCGSASVPFDVTSGTPCVGDSDGNGFINLSDVNALIAFLNVNAGPPFYSVSTSSGTPEMDVDLNGFINLSDVNALIAFLNVNAGPPFYSVACP